MVINSLNLTMHSKTDLNVKLTEVYFTEGIVHVPFPFISTMPKRNRLIANNPRGTDTRAIEMFLESSSFEMGASNVRTATTHAGLLNRRPVSSWASVEAPTTGIHSQKS